MAAGVGRVWLSLAELYLAEKDKMDHLVRGCSLSRAFTQVSKLPTSNEIIMKTREYHLFGLKNTFVQIELSHIKSKRQYYMLELNRLVKRILLVLPYRSKEPSFLDKQPIYYQERKIPSLKEADSEGHVSLWNVSQEQKRDEDRDMVRTGAVSSCSAQSS